MRLPSDGEMVATFAQLEGRVVGADGVDRMRVFRAKRGLRGRLQDAAARGDARAARRLSEPCRGCGDVLAEGQAVCVTCGAQVGCSEGCP